MAATAMHESEQTLTAWATALIEAGWTPHQQDTPPHLTGLRHLVDPAARVQAHAHAHHAGDIDVELRSSARRDDGRLLWYVIAGWLTAPAVIAAAQAADDQATGIAAGDLLARAGWRLVRYEAFTATCAEHQWSAPTRHVGRATPPRTPIRTARAGTAAGSCRTPARTATASASPPARAPPPRSSPPSPYPPSPSPSPACATRSRWAA